MNNKVEKTNSHFKGLLNLIIYALAIWGVLSIIDNYIHSIEFVHKVNNGLIHLKSNKP
jgi:purine-cytosine permease-like protein